MIKRRKVLLGMGTSVVLTGCSGGSDNGPTKTETSTEVPTEASTPTPTDTPTPTPTNTPTPTPTDTSTPTPTEEEPSDKEIMEMMGSSLSVFGITMRSYSIEGDEAQIVYESVVETTDDIIQDMRDVSESYHGAVLQGVSTERLFAEMAPPDRDPVGSYIIENEWIMQIENDEITESELLSKMLGTLESY
ncbi:MULTISPECIES: hypothetical protein [Halobellus]|uniref:hypothetical protein n=1 Tax=Halobellus TaxID=1073986 RepID=UPI0021144A85|nr:MULTISPECIES: hypothetical protein [Halobellus]MDQ2055509.1 hypothetical protein [Halobellus sp. H-GB7]